MNFFELARTETHDWFSQELGRVNDNTVSLRVMQQTTVDFHVHEGSDEMFVVLSGALFLDIEGQTHELKAGDTHVVRAGLSHRTRSSGRAELISILRGK